MAADVCRCLELKTGRGSGSTGQYLRRLGADEKRLITRAGGIGSTLFVDTPAPSLTAVSESGLYKLIMRSDKATARPFQDWVTKDVLPAICKTGGGPRRAQVDATESWRWQLTRTLGEWNRVQDILKNHL